MQVAKEIKSSKQIDKKNKNLGMFILKIKGRIRIRMKTTRLQYDESQPKMWKTYRKKRAYEFHQLED